MDVDVSEEKKDTKTWILQGTQKSHWTALQMSHQLGGAKQEKQMPWQRPPMDLYAT